MTNNQLTEQQIDLLIENGYDIAHTLENLAENEINSDCFEVFSYSENGRETEWDGKITEFAQRAAKAIRHLTDATTALQAELQERRKVGEPELNLANLANKFYERYPLATFKSDSERAEAFGYFMAGAEVQCFGEFIKYDDLCGDE
ncbi:hypothetical protein PGO14_06710 [Klebsiella aerogenes]